MKTTLLAFVSYALFAQTSSVPLGVALTQGTTTLYCELIDLRQFGGLFATDKPSIMCLLKSSNSATSEFAVTITTQNASGTTHTYSDHAAVVVGYSPLSFPTDDTVLLSVTVQEKALLAQNTFGVQSTSDTALSRP